MTFAPLQMLGVLISPPDLSLVKELACGPDIIESIFAIGLESI